MCVCIYIYYLWIIIIVDSKKQDNLFIDPEWKGFTVLNILNLVFSFCIFVGVLVLIKDKLKNLKCDTKTSRKKIKRKSNRSIFKPRNSKLSTKSKIDLRKIQSYMSSTDDSECESVIFYQESVC